MARVYAHVGREINGGSIQLERLRSTCGGDVMGTWKFDPLHTQVEFSAKHFGMMTVRGNFHEVVASGEIYPDAPERSKIEATINTASIRTHNEQRDNDLR